MKENNSKASKSQLRILLDLYKYSAEHRSTVIWAIAASILNKILDLFPPILIGLAVDTVVKSDQSFIGQLMGYSQFQQLLAIAALTVIVWLLESFFEYLFSIKWKYLAQVIQHKIRMDTYGHILKMDQRFFESQQSGNLISIINDDVNQLERFLDVGINDLIQITVTVLAIGSLYFIKSPFLAALSFITMPLIVYGGVWFQQFLTPLYRKVRDRVGLLTSELNNNLQGMSTIKSFAREKESFEKLNALSMEYYRANEKAIKVSSLFTPLIRILVMVGFLMTLLVGGNLTLKGQIDVGTYSVMIFMIQRLLWPLTRLGQTLDLFQRAMASVSRIFELMAAPINMLDGSIIPEAHSIKGQLELRDVNFAYNSKEGILNDFNLSIQPKESIGVVGSTGSGKSTLIKLLQRFYDPDRGEIKLDGKNLKEYDLHALRSAISVVGQDVYLFHGTILENLLFAKPEATLSEIHEACQASCIHEFIVSLSEGYNTIVGERGQRLSGGQKQRLSIARAILADSPIIVLDEATSAVDNVTEARLQFQLQKILDTKTTIIIAHRLSTVINCDRILVLEKGRILEEGDHTKLLQQEGVYHSLWNVQTGAEVVQFQ